MNVRSVALPSQRLSVTRAFLAVLGLTIALLVAGLGTPAQAAEFKPVKPGMEGSRVVSVQKRLVHAGMTLRKPSGTYDKATEKTVKQFQAKFGISQTGTVGPVTWKALKALTKGGARLDSRCLGVKRAICVDKTQKVVRLVKNGKVVQVMDSRFGGPGMRTREGKFSVQRKSRNHVSSLYGSPMPFALFFSGGQAVHYSPDFAKKGYAGASHGCVNLRDKRGAEKLFDLVRFGDRVVVYAS